MIKIISRKSYCKVLWGFINLFIIKKMQFTDEVIMCQFLTMSDVPRKKNLISNQQENTTIACINTR